MGKAVERFAEPVWSNRSIFLRISKSVTTATRNRSAPGGQVQGSRPPTDDAVSSNVSTIAGDRGDGFPGSIPPAPLARQISAKILVGEAIDMPLPTGPHHHVPLHDFVPLALTFAFWIVVLTLVFLVSR